MNLAIGLIVSHGFPAPTRFWGSYEAVKLHVSEGLANAALPDDLKISGVTVLKSTAFPIDVARNAVVRDFLDTRNEWLFFMDADMTFPEDVIPRLLSRRKSVISGRYHMRKEPYHAVAYVKHRVVDGPNTYAPIHYGRGVIEIERGGAGCLLIHRSVLEHIRTRIGDNWFRYQRGPEAPHDFTVSEDFWFYRQARESGFPCFLDWDCECEHLQEMGINRSWNEAYLDAQVREMAAMSPEGRDAILSSLVACGFPDGYRLANGATVPQYEYTAGER